MSQSEPGSIRFLCEAAFQFVDYASDQDGHLESGNAAMAAYVGRRLDQNWRWLDYALTRFIEPRYQGEASDGTTLDGEPFEDLVVVLFNRDWSVQYAYRLPIETVRRHHKQPGRQGCRLMIRGDDSWRDDPAVEEIG